MISPIPGSDRPHERLAPVLGLFTAITLTVGEVIGSGIFFKPSVIARSLDGQVGWILLLWVICGLVNLCGALTLAELSAMFPRAGGNYVFLTEAYGQLWGFLWGWAEFWVIRTGAIAALGTAMAMSLEQLFVEYGRALPVAESTTFHALVAIPTIVVLGTVNVLGTRFGGAVQNLTTVFKICFLAFLTVLPVLAAERATGTGESWALTAPTPVFWSGIGAALAGMMWAYDGWGQVTVVAEEVRDPGRNVPRALIGGLLILIALYLGANVGYHLTLPADRIADSSAPAAEVAETLLPGWGRRLVLYALVVSTFGAMNSNILVGPRVLFAVARDMPALGPLRRIDPRTGTPALAIAAVCGWSCLLVAAGGLSPNPDKRLFDVLTDYAIFGGSLFYFAAVLAVFVFRRRLPDWPRPYRTWGYPYTSLLFGGFYVFLLGSMFWSNPRESLSGLVLIVLGLVIYRWMAPRRGGPAGAGS